MVRFVSALTGESSIVYIPELLDKSDPCGDSFVPDELRGTMEDRCIYEFDHYRLEPSERLLLSHGRPVALTERAFQVLLALVRRSGHLVEKADLIQEVWGGAFVEEGNLTVTISMLRKALGDDRNGRRLIETVAKQGYRFLPVVTVVATSGEDSHRKEQEKAESFRSDTGLLNHLRRRDLGLAAMLVAVPLVVVLMVGPGSGVQASGEDGGQSRELLVVPFNVQNPDEDSVRIRNALTASLMASLAGSRSVTVRELATKETIEDRDLRSVARQQRADAILSGSVGVKDGDTQITVRLTNPAGETVWSEPYQSSLSRVGDLMERVDAETAEKIEGRYFWNKRTESGLRRSIECFQQAILKDPDFAEAYAGLADSYTLLASYGVEPPAEAYPNARAAALKALQLDPNLAEAHTSLGLLAFYYEWDWARAGHELRKAIELDPNASAAHMWNSLYSGAMGDLSQATRQAIWAQRLEPLSLAANMDLGSVYYLGRHYDKAVSQYRRAIVLDPYFARAHSRLGITLLAQKDYVGAAREFTETRALAGPDPYIDGLIGYARALSGDKATTRRMLHELLEQSQRHEYVPAYSLALLYLGLGENDQAIDWLERARQDRSTYLIFADVDPLLDPLRSDERFALLLQRMHLPTLRADNSSLPSVPGSRLEGPH